jgi:hypothetical protein
MTNFFRKGSSWGVEKAGNWRPPRMSSGLFPSADGRWWRSPAASDLVADERRSYLRA